MNYRFPQRVERLQLPERSPLLGQPVGQAERQLGREAANGQYLNLTYADTKRFPPFPPVLDRFTSAARGAGQAYTPYRGDPTVLQQVAANVGAFLNVAVDPERDLMLTPGTQAGLFTAAAALVEHGDTVVIMDPEYLSDERMLRFFGANVVHVPLRWEGTEEPAPDFDAFEAALKANPKLVLFSNPNNPTGAVFSRKVLQQMADLILRTDALVVVDELYSRLVYDGRPFCHFVTLNGVRDRTVTLLGPSKTESMSGYRLGVAVAPPEVVTAMEDVLAVSALRAPAYAQHTLLEWLANDHDYISHRVSEYQSLRDYTVGRLNACEFMRVTPAQGTAYLFPRLVGIDASDQDVAKALLQEAGVIINPGYQFGPGGMGHFRICFAQDEGAWDRALGRMIHVLEGLGRRRVARVAH